MRAVALLLTLACALGGCGVPGESDVAVRGPGREANPASGPEEISEPPGRTATSDVREFVENFLMAAAGPPETALDRVRAFVPPDVPWAPQRDLLVVRMDPGQPVIDGSRVTFTVTVLGVLARNGAVEPRGDRATRPTYTIDVAELEPPNQGLWVLAPPPVLLLSDQALDAYYERRTLYFWSAGGPPTLVPDLRYVPRRLPASQRPTQIIQWLLGGPSSLVTNVVQRLPDGAQLVGNVPDPNPAGGELVVELSKAADTGNEGQVDRLATQLRWSLRPPGGGSDPDLELKIDQLRKRYTGNAYLPANPAFRAGAEAEPFAVYQGRVHRLAPVPQGAAPLARLAPASNAAVQAAALSRLNGRTQAALVRTGPGRRPVLEVGVGGPPVLPPLRRLDLRPRRMGQPTWIPGTSLGLVVADGRLYRFGLDTVMEVGPVLRGLTAIAVPPDGRRLAYVRGGRLYVAQLVHDESSISLGAVREVPISLDQVTAVGWSQQDWLVVAGLRGGRLSFADITVDGAVRKHERGDDRAAAEVTHLVALPDDPANGPGAGQVMYVADGAAYVLFADEKLLTTADLADVSPPVGPGGPGPAAPFFAE